MQENVYSVDSIRGMWEMKFPLGPVSVTQLCPWLKSKGGRQLDSVMHLGFGDSGNVYFSACLFSNFMPGIYCPDYSLTWLEAVRYSSYGFV